MTVVLVKEGMGEAELREASSARGRGRNRQDVRRGDGAGCDSDEGRASALAQESPACGGDAVMRVAIPAAFFATFFLERKSARPGLNARKPDAQRHWVPANHLPG